MRAISEDRCRSLKSGVSGIMRVKNDGEFVVACIDSCIAALDELIIVYNDCSDNTPELVRRKEQEYPDKIKVFEYKHKVYSVNLSKEEYEYALSLPEDSPSLLCNYYNYALSKVSYKYAIKIDADQIYFPKQLEKWCDVCRSENLSVASIKYFMGFVFNLYFMLFKFLCFKSNKVYSLMPSWLVRWSYPYYIDYAKTRFLKGCATLSLSGVNVVKDDNTWFVSLGKQDKIINILPPFNGDGDHLLFRVSPQTYYVKYDMPYYNLLTSGKYSLIECFHHPYKILPVGFSWFHVNAMRKRNLAKVLQAKGRYPGAFVELRQFVNMRYAAILSKSGRDMFVARHRALFMFIFKGDIGAVKQNISILQKYDPN